MSAWGLGELAVSSVTFWETGALVRKGRVNLGAKVSSWREEIIALGVRELALDGAMASLSQELDGLPPEPGDRLIVATAILTESVLLTADERLLAWPGELARIDAGR